MGKASTDLALVFGGVFLVLVFASALSAFLRFRYSPDGRNVVLENLDARIMSWWAIVGLLAFAFIWGKTGVIVLFGLCSFAALREFVTLTSTNRADHWALAASFFVVLPLQYILVWHEWYGLYSIFIPVYAFLFIPIFYTSCARSNVSHFWWNSGPQLAIWCRCNGRSSIFILKCSRKCQWRNNKC